MAARWPPDGIASGGGGAFARSHGLRRAPSFALAAEAAHCVYTDAPDCADFETAPYGSGVAEQAGLDDHGAHFARAFLQLAAGPAAAGPEDRIVALAT